MTEGPLEHRRFLDADAPLAVAKAGLFARIGGQPCVDRVVDVLYDRFEADEQLRPLFGRDLTSERANQKRFFAEWLGAGDLYSQGAHAGLAHRHDRLPITRQLAGRWLGHFRRALDATVPSEADRAIVFAHAQTIAFALVNEKTTAGRLTRAERSKVYQTDRASELAHKGQLPALRALIKQSPDTLRRPTKAARIMQAAVLAGRAEAVKLLLEAEVDPDRPHYLPVNVSGLAFERVLFVTPLCAARLKRRSAVEALLLKHGAREDPFTSAYLGDLGRLAQQLKAHPGLAQAGDPATDVVTITPVHHAVAGGRVEALRSLLAQTSEPIRGGLRALRGAAERDSLEVVSVLLDRGVEATGLGHGRWVCNPEIAPLLVRAGASVRGPANHWVRASCTGNQARKDDPEYVRALLKYGARVDDRYGGATALHHAAKAGFVGSVQVLLEQGADPQALDDEGRTPLQWVERAAKTVAREPVRRLLRSRR